VTIRAGRPSAGVRVQAGKRYREECLREGIDPRIAVEIEALMPGLLRQRLDVAIEALDGIRQWNIESRTEEAGRELLRSLQGAVGKIVRSTTGRVSRRRRRGRVGPVHHMCCIS
jgi:hypothetical protein